MKKLSVIVPVYNARKYLADCIESLAGQSYKNLEILLIDDGSTDDSGRICDQYASSSDRIICIHTPNQGVMEARNTGIRHASGEYITFCDADDGLDLDTYEILVGLLEKYHCDMASCGRVVEYREKLPVKKQQTEHKEPVICGTKREVMGSVLSVGPGMSGYVWNKVFTRDAIEGVLFRQDVAITDDLMFVWDAVKRNVEKACYIDLPMYHYRYVYSSLTKSSNIQRQIKALRAWNMIRADVEALGYDECRPCLGKNMINWSLKITEKMAFSEETDAKVLRMVRHYLKQNKEYVSLVGIKNRVLTHVLLHSWSAYKVLARVFEILKRQYVGIRGNSGRGKTGR